MYVKKEKNKSNMIIKFNKQTW